MFLLMLAYLLLLASLQVCVAGVRTDFGVQTVPVVYPVDWRSCWVAGVPDIAGVPVFVGTINGALVCVVATVVFSLAGIPAGSVFSAMYVLCFFWHLCCCTRLRESLALFKSFNTPWYWWWSYACVLVCIISKYARPATVTLRTHSVFPNSTQLWLGCLLVKSCTWLLLLRQTFVTALILQN